MASSLPSLSAGPASASSGSNANLYEETHVHEVYEAIAPHFSATRHKPWPFVSSFLASQPPGSVGLDVGCGNGKNMGVNHDVVMLGCDRSAALVTLAKDSWCCSGRLTRGQQHHQQNQQQPAPSQDKQEVKDTGTGTATATAAHGPVIAGADVAVADGLVLPFREGSADFVICIAVIHHLSTKARRIDAIRQLLRCIRRRTDPVEKHQEQEQEQGGQVLVYVWALEQSNSRRGWDEGGEQDLLVPWVMKAPQQKKKKKQPPSPKQQGQASNKREGESKNKKNKKDKGASNGRESKDALATSRHAAVDAAAVGSAGTGGGTCNTEGGAAIIIANSSPEKNNSITSGGESGEGGRDAVVMQGHQQESHNNDLVDRFRDVSRETKTSESKTTVATEDKAAVEEKEQLPGKTAAEESGVATAAADDAKNASAAVEDNAKRADDGQQQGHEEQGQGPRNKQVVQHGEQNEQEASTGEKDADKTFHRFYHLYKKGELEEDVAAAGGKVLSSGYERDNWWVIAV